MTNNVAALQLDQGDAFYAPQPVQSVDEPAALVLRKVDLTGIARNNHLAAVAEASQKHEHLRHGGVLSLVENDDTVVECPAAHEREGNDLNHIIHHESLHLLKIHHVVKRIEQRPQIWIHLGL